jgi:hypothetical protein
VGVSDELKGWPTVSRCEHLCLPANIAQTSVEQDVVKCLCDIRYLGRGKRCRSVVAANLSSGHIPVLQVQGRRHSRVLRHLWKASQFSILLCSLFQSPLSCLSVSLSLSFSQCLSLCFSVFLSVSMSCVSISLCISLSIPLLSQCNVFLPCSSV